MNVTELARKLGMNTATLLEILPGFGFDIGKKAIKVDDRVAQNIMRQSKRIKDELERRRQDELKKRKELDRQMRQERGEKVMIPEVITVRDFAARLSLPVTTIITELMKNGILANLNQNIDRDTAAVIAEDLGFAVEMEAAGETKEADDSAAIDALQTALSVDTGEALKPRPPVVVVMGHVDHGKTKLLDAIRNTNVVATESGGITQHIGAYQVEHVMKDTKEKRKITFIDTPGHEAFTVMRSRGARIADIAILVIAADDSIMPQTVEAINIIKAAKLPMVVAINKIDKQDADANRVKSDLTKYNIVAEEWGGKTPMIGISAKEGTNIDILLENILLVGEVESDHIRANPDRPAVGTIIEARVDKGAGPVATVLVQAGTLHRGDALVVNNKIYGTVRAMKNYRNEDVDVAPPSTPVKILGFKIAPEVGDILDVSQEATAAKVRKTKASVSKSGAVLAATPPAEASEDEVQKKVFNVVIKADVLGSLEAILGSIEKFRHDEVAVKVVGKGLGNVTEGDADRAAATDAEVLAFRVLVPQATAEVARTKRVAIKRFEVIYALLEHIEEKLQELLPAERIVTEHGRMKVLAIFRTDRGAMTVGGRVEEGKVPKGAKIRVKRNNFIVGEGVAETLQIAASPQREVPAGTECGMRFSGRVQIEVDDVLEAYTEEVRERKIVFSIPGKK